MVSISHFCNSQSDCVPLPAPCQVKRDSRDERVKVAGQHAEKGLTGAPRMIIRSLDVGSGVATVASDFR